MKAPEPFKKIKHILAGITKTTYRIELVCPACNFFSDISVVVVPPDMLTLSTVTWSTPHICDKSIPSSVRLDRGAETVKKKALKNG